MYYEEYSNYEDVKSLSPKEVSMWEDEIEIKESIDEAFSMLEDQVFEFRNIGVPIYIRPSDFKGFEQYIYNKYIDMLIKFHNNNISILNIDNIAILPSEAYKTFDVFYRTFYVDPYDFISEMTMSECDKEHINGHYEYVKSTVVIYFETNINKLKKARKLLKNETSIKLINKQINEIFFVKACIEAESPQTVSEFVYNIITNY